MKACPFPEKRKLTKVEAHRQRDALRHKRGQFSITSFRCPAGGHWHLGNKRGVRP